jgi:hypothetical protein
MAAIYWIDSGVLIQAKKIDVPFDDAVRAFLNTPPRPAETTGSRKVKPKARKGTKRKTAKKR